MFIMPGSRVTLVVFDNSESDFIIIIIKIDCISTKKLQDKSHAYYNLLSCKLTVKELRRDLTCLI